jgi:hypothetical protein
MQAICNRAGLFINDIELPEIHGGSYVFYISAKNKQSKSLKNRIMEEQKSGRNNKNLYDGFQRNITSISQKVRKKIKNKTMVAFGAAAKGIVSLHALDLNPHFIVDENPLKIGKLLPKKNIPIVSITELSKLEEDLDILILAWNFKNEIIEKIQEIRGSRDNIITIF